MISMLAKKLKNFFKCGQNSEQSAFLSFRYSSQCLLSVSLSVFWLCLSFWISPCLVCLPVCLCWEFLFFFSLICWKTRTIQVRLVCTVKRPPPQAVMPIRAMSNHHWGANKFIFLWRFYCSGTNTSVFYGTFHSWRMNTFDFLLRLGTNIFIFLCLFHSLETNAFVFLCWILKFCKNFFWLSHY